MAQASPPGSPGLWQEDRTPASENATQRKKVYTHEQVEEVRMVLRLLPMFWSTFFYWTVYSQMQSLFVSQGTLMRTKVNLSALLGRKLGKDFVVPAASLSSFDTISIIVLIPLYDKVLVPLLGKLNIRITVLQRIGIGLVLASLAMVCAGLVERDRLKLADQGKFVAERDNSFSRIDGPPAVDMSV